jgi:hypothetical protein
LQGSDCKIPVGRRDPKAQLACQDHPGVGIMVTDFRLGGSSAL